MPRTPTRAAAAMTEFATDYLVIGAGAAGLAFADTLVAETDAHVTIVDRHAKPGGHWNDAYDFVTLHQPSAFYGVASLELGERRVDAVGTNRGLYELATGAEINAYFERVMNRRLLPSGRVSYRPLSTHVGDGEVESVLTGERMRIRARRRVVDATYLSPSVPSTHVPRFDVAGGVALVPPNALPALWRTAAGDAARPRRFVVVGAGKTAMDALVWLLGHGVAADALQWVVPRDAWLINRVTTQPGPEFFREAIGGQADQMEAFAEATSVADLFLRLEARGIVLRVDSGRTPTMFHLATVSPGEVERLRQVRDVVRLGHVKRLAADAIELDGGRVAVAPGTLFVDCTASAVERRPTQPVFQDRRIVLQLLRLPQPAFSAALTAHVEAVHDGDDAAKNRLCGSVPFPHTLAEYPRAMIASLWNQFQWGQDKALRQWIRDNRLDGFGRLMSGVDPADTEKQAVLGRLKAAAGPALANLQRLAGMH